MEIIILSIAKLHFPNISKYLNISIRPIQLTAIRTPMRWARAVKIENKPSALSESVNPIIDGGTLVLRTCSTGVLSVEVFGLVPPYETSCLELLDRTWKPLS